MNYKPAYNVYWPAERGPESFRNKIEASLTQKLDVLKHNAVQIWPHLYNLPDLLYIPKFHTSSSKHEIERNFDLVTIDFSWINLTSPSSNRLMLVAFDHFCPLFLLRKKLEGKLLTHGPCQNLMLQHTYAYLGNSIY